MLRNPYTGRLIQEGGETHRRLLANQYGGFTFGKKKSLANKKLNADDVLYLLRELEEAKQIITEIHSDLNQSNLAETTNLYKQIDNINDKIMKLIHDMRSYSEFGSYKSPTLERFKPGLPPNTPMQTFIDRSKVLSKFIVKN